MAAGFAWDGVTDVIFYSSFAGTGVPGGGWTGGFSIHSAPRATPGTAQRIPPDHRHGAHARPARSACGSASRSALPSCFGLVGTTTGGGTGDLNLTVINLSARRSPRGSRSSRPRRSATLGSGPFFGIWPDGAHVPGHRDSGRRSATRSISWPESPGVYPDAPFIVPPGTLSFLGGQVWDAVVVALAPGLVYVNRTNVVRLNW